MPKTNRKRFREGMRLQNPSASDIKNFPEIHDLVSHLRFAPSNGRIWLGDQRMLMVHSRAFATLRQELIGSLGLEKARGYLTRMGYVAGSMDAEFARKIRPGGKNFDVFAVGPQLHSLEGMVLIESVVKFEFDPQSKHYYGEYIWKESAESEEHVACYGVGSEPVCWMQVGYASGYTSAFVGRPIMYRETKCLGMGDPHCCVIGKPVEEWDDQESDKKYFLVTHSLGNTGRPTASEQKSKTDYQSNPLTASHIEEEKALPLSTRPVGISAGFTTTCHLISRVAPTRATVLLMGESGVGKEIFAKMLHSLSPRANSAFVPVNCAAIPDQLIESELFGAVKGAYTGATQSRPGYFENADGGTLFLDEVSSLGYVAQGKLLRALQEREIQRVGDTQARSVDVRVVAATNDDLREKVRSGTFREDLFFRLNVFPIRIPPLRERREDIPLLINYFFKKYCSLHERSLGWFSPRSVDALLSYDWPGNIRELENMIERAVILAPENGVIEPRHIFEGTESIPYEGRGNLFPSDIVDDGFDVRLESKSSELMSLSTALKIVIHQGTLSMDEIMDLCIKQAVDLSDGNITAAARLLNLSRAQVAYHLKKI